MNHHFQTVLKHKQTVFMLSESVVEDILSSEFPDVDFNFTADHPDAYEAELSFLVLKNLADNLDMDDVLVEDIENEVEGVSPDGAWGEFLTVLARRDVVPEGTYVVWALG